MALCAPRSLARDRGARRREFRFPLEESHQEEVKGSVWALGVWKGHGGDIKDMAGEDFRTE